MTSPALHILLVDDNDDDIVLITEAFADCDRSCAITSVQDGVQALDFLRQAPPHADAAPPDLVLLDINMPRLDGFGVLEAIQQAPALSDIPVVVLSTSENGDDVRRAMALGARDCLHKPVGFDQLRELAARVLSRWAQPPGGP